MFIVKEGYPFIIASLVVAAIVYFLFGAYWTVIPVVLAVYFAYFFRDFHRSMPYDPNILYSPADGTVMGVEEIFDDEYLNEPALKLTIFLSVFNVHTNRSPLDGEIKYQRYTCGQFVPAYEKSASFENERHAVGIDNGRIRFLVIQVAGLLARRIVSWVTVGHQLKQVGSLEFLAQDYELQQYEYGIDNEIGHSYAYHGHSLAHGIACDIEGTGAEVGDNG